MNQETTNTKIPKLRPMRGNTFSLEFQSMRNPISPKKKPISKASSLINLAYQYRKLTPEQCEVKYKKYPRKIARRSCMVCSMRKPQFCGFKLSGRGMSTQTAPPLPVQPRWNVESQTEIPKMVIIRTLQRHTQTRGQKFVKQDKSRRRSLFFLWCLFSLAIIFVGAILANYRFNFMEDLLPRKIIHPKNILERILFRLNRNKSPIEPPARDLSNTIMPTVGSVTLCLLINFILFKLGICDLFRM